MKKLKLIYNPHSGDKTFMFSLDACIQEFQAGGYETHVFRTMAPGDIDSHVADMAGDYDMIVASGGDGGVNLVVNAMMRHGVTAPLGIIPSGTANDFATYLKMPKEHQAAAAALMRGRALPCDLGLANGTYFINVCGAGLWTNISQQIDARVKDSLGKLAYYIKGVAELPNFVPFPVRITTPSGVIEDELFLFIALNSAGTGGFERLSPDASIHDGLFDFLALRAQQPRELARLFVKILKGDFLDDEGILFFRDSTIKVECTLDEQHPLFSETDVDGEAGPKLPVEITNIRHAIRIVVPEEYDRA